MKSLLTILTLLFVTVAAQAYTGGTKNASASFDCQVIAPLTINSDTDYDLTTDYPIVAGTTREFSLQIPFEINGEANDNITVNTYGEWDVNDVSFSSGSGWSTIPTVLDGSGQATMSFDITGVDADGTAHGVYTYTLSIDVHYTDM